MAVHGKNLWRKLARFFDMELAPPQHISLTRLMAGKGPVWDRIATEHKLQPYRYEEIAASAFGDFVFASDYDIVSDTSKARRFGFHGCADTEETVRRVQGKSHHPLASSSRCRGREKNASGYQERLIREMI